MTKQKIYEVVPALKFVQFKRLDYPALDLDFPIRVNVGGKVLDVTLRPDTDNHCIKEVNVVISKLIILAHPYSNVKVLFSSTFDEDVLRMMTHVTTLLDKANGQIQVALHNQDCRETVRGIVTDLPKEMIFQLWHICLDASVSGFGVGDGVTNYQIQYTKNSIGYCEDLVPPRYLVTAGPEGTALVQLVTNILEQP